MSILNTLNPFFKWLEENPKLHQNQTPSQKVAIFNYYRGEKGASWLIYEPKIEHFEGYYCCECHKIHNFTFETEECKGCKKEMNLSADQVAWVHSKTTDNVYPFCESCVSLGIPAKWK